MGNNKKAVAVFSTLAMATMISAALSMPAKAADGDIYKLNDLSKTAYTHAATANFGVQKIISLDSANYGYEVNSKVYKFDDLTAVYAANNFNTAAALAAIPTTKEAVGPAGQATAVTVQSVNAITDTKLTIVFSAPVESTTAANFNITPGITVNSATISADKKSAVLDVSGAIVGTNYSVKATGLMSNGVVQPDSSISFAMPDASALFKPTLTSAKTTLKSDGLTSTLVTFTLKDATGATLTNADKVEVAFTSTFGRFAENKVTVQNGVATVLFVSETLDAARTANIEATIVAAANTNTIGVKASNTIVLDPNPDRGEEQTAGATLTEAQAAQGDRVIAYFNKDVKASNYTDTLKADGVSFDTTGKKATAVVTTNINNDGTIGEGKVVKVKYVLPVAGNSKALQLVLDTEDEKFPLVNNANLSLAFTDSVGTLPVQSTKYAKLTDSRTPALLSAVNQGLTQLVLTFSEPVSKATASDAIANYTIDGVKLDDASFGLGTKAVIADTDSTQTDAEKEVTKANKRNVVTITLGKNATGNQIYLKAGDHSIQGSSIADWAGNVSNTQTLDFSIASDVTAPTATVAVQSPEQSIVTFTKVINENATNLITLQKLNKTTNVWENETKQAIKVTKLTDVANAYKVETTKDWTDTSVYDTVNSKLNYYNDSYRLVVAKDAVSTAANGTKNAELDLTLGGVMLTPDTTSPVISSINEVKAIDGTVSGYNAIMSEPVKVSDGTAVNGVYSADELDTFAQGQTSLPVVTAQFIKKDGSKTIGGTVSAVADPYNKTISVKPSTKLDPGTWTLVVRSISDDIGNTAASATHDFIVDGTIATANKFAVDWTYADLDKDFTNDAVVKDGVAEDLDKTADYVYVKFNKAISVTGDAKNVLKTSNYQLDAKALPTGTQIRANIAGLDDKDAVSDSITIVLPEGYLKGIAAPHVLTISSGLESTTAGDTLTNGGALKLAWTADNSTLKLESYMLQKLVGTDNATVSVDKDGKNIVSVITPTTKLVDLLLVSNINVANLDSIEINGVNVLATKDPAQVKTALESAIPGTATADKITLADLVDQSVKVNGVSYTVSLAK
ncbi:hypothetical protein [Clostridium estertheticum]|uniref:hypothetical protein n=1 Tax=Clostridium estertheticum TaxID=238834 RepID=UPI001CF292BA|nr:hypothetical protein [Clostridium estertheticum]MCB2339557.1 hypothetical protein [Clostridium estertheticum]